MWDDLVRKLDDYSTAILTVGDAAGYPFSIRCIPRPDPDRQVVEVTLPDYVRAETGAASLLCHFHDDLLWNHTNFLAYGDLENDGDGRWIFRPTRLIEGAGPGNSPLPQMRFRRSARHYLDRHDMDWPQVPWADLRAIYRKAQESQG